VGEAAEQEQEKREKAHGGKVCSCSVFRVPCSVFGWQRVGNALVITRGRGLDDQQSLGYGDVDSVAGDWALL
jgi:hypothetical protein